MLDVILGTAKSCFTIPLLSLFPLNICEKKRDCNLEFLMIITYVSMIFKIILP